MARQVVPLVRGPMVDPATGQLLRPWAITQDRVHAAAGAVETLLTVVMSLADIPTTLTQGDAGLLVGLLTPYNHLLQWTGELWRFAPGDVGNGFVRTFAAGIAPQEPGWQLCDGTTTTYLIVGASVLRTQAFTTPVTANTYFRR